VTTEIELKLALDPAAVARLPQLLRDPALVAVKRGRARRARLVSTYFDTPDFRLARDGIALRLRRAGTRWLQAVKGPPLAAAGAGLHARSEFEAPVTRAALDPRQLAQTPWRKPLLKAHRKGRLAARFTTDFERTTVPLEFADGTFASFAIDVGTIRAKGRRAVPIAEIEIELEAGDPARLFELGRALAERWPMTIGVLNKAQRGLALVHDRPDGWDQPVHAGNATLPRDADAAAALAVIVRECLDQIAGNACGLIADDDPEWVHQMRIGTRRLRSCLALVAPFVPAHRLDPVVVATGALADALGQARDWDVFATQTLPPLTAWFGRDPATAPGLRRLRARLAPRRRAARDLAREAVRAPWFTHLLLAAGAFAATPRLGAVPSADGTDPLRAPARSFAAELLDRRQRKLERRGHALVGGTPEERHATRIAAKKMRYAAEFFAPLFPRKRARLYLKALARLQDALGQFNDAATAARLATEIASPGDAIATGAVQGWVAAQAAALQPELAAAWNRYCAAPRFWMRD